MRVALLHALGDVRVEDPDEPRIEKTTDAVIRLAAVHRLAPATDEEYAAAPATG